MNSMLHVSGTHPDTLKAATTAIVEVLKAAGTEGAQVAAVNALASLAHAPQSLSINNCVFENKPAPKRKR